MSKLQAHPIATCFAISLSFVFSIYALVPASIRVLERNNETHIKYRIRSILVITLAWLFMICYFGVLGSDRSVVETLELMGIRQPTMDLLVRVWYPLFSFVVLFMGPIIQRIQASNLLGDYFEENTMWITYRAIVFAPIFEEIVFRSYVCSILLNSGYTKQFVCYVSPLFFGIAHAHHAVELYYKEVPMQNIVVSTVFQFSYTYFFGVLETIVFINTNQLVCIVLIHSFCNFMGFPDFVSATKSGALIAIYLVSIYLFAFVFFFPSIDAKAFDSKYVNYT